MMSKTIAAITLILSLMSLFSFLAYAEDPDSGIIINMPDEVSVLQTFPIEIYIPPELRSNLSDDITISSTNCENPFISPAKLMKYSTSLKYDGEAYFDLRAFIIGSVSEELPKNCEIKFIFNNKEAREKYEILEDIDLNPAGVNVKLPDLEWEYQKDTWDDFRVGTSWRYENDDVSTGTINENTEGVRYYQINVDYGSEYGSSTIDRTLLLQEQSFKEYVEEKTRARAEQLEDFVWDHKHPGQVEMIALPQFESAYGRIIGYIDMTSSMEYVSGFRRTHRIYAKKEAGQLLTLRMTIYGRLETKEEVEELFEKFDEEVMEFASTFRLDETDYEFTPLDKSKFEDISDEIEEPEEKEEEEEQKDISEKEFEIDFFGKGKKTIWNRGRINTGKDDDNFQILVKIKGKAYDDAGKRIRKISDSQLYSGVDLIARIRPYEPKNPELEKPESQIGFGGSLSEKWIRSVSSDQEAVDVMGKGPHLYKGFYRPKEVIDVHLEWNGEIVSEKLTYTVNLKDASPTIKIKKPTIEVQDGDQRGIGFSVEDADESKLTCSMMVPTGFAHKGGIPTASLMHNNQRTTLIKVDCEDGDVIEAMYHAPSFGNFDLNNELNALSMWKMQQNTIKTLATDLIGFGVEARINKLDSKAKAMNKVYEMTGTAEHMKNAKRLEEAAGALGKASDMAGDANNLIQMTQMGKSVDNLEKKGKEATGTGKQGWLEWGADWGVWGIDLAQTTVGAIAMAPGKLPIVGPLGKKMGSGFSTTFNLMTNVWKGNFEYLSKVEKINRAKEMTFPYPVIYTIEDEDGFVTKDVQNVMIIYNWLE